MSGSITLLRFHLEKAIEQIDRLEDAGQTDDADYRGAWPDLPTAAAELGISQALLRGWCRDKGAGNKPYGRWRVNMARAKQLLGR